MLDFLRLLIHALAAPLRTQAQLEAESPCCASAECASQADPAASADGGRPAALRVAVPAVSVVEECHHDRSAGHGAALAPLGLPALLAMEVAFTWWAAQGPDRGSQLDPANERREPAVGRATDPRRTAEARDRGRAVNGRQVHGQASAKRFGPDLEDVLHNHAAGIGAMDFLMCRQSAFACCLFWSSSGTNGGASFHCR